MGTDKALLQLAGKPLIVRAIELARDTVSDVKIVGSPGKFAAFGPAIEDIYHDRGPLGGIHAALRESEAELNLMLAVDLPFIPTPFLKYLLACAEASNATVTVPLLTGYFQPLCAVYRKEFSTPADRALAEGRNKIDQLFREVTLCTISEKDMAASGFNSSIFRNLNTPEDWEEAVHDFCPES
jgi:molybdenum cofactor guanylyltransferase